MKGEDKIHGAGSGDAGPVLSLSPPLPSLSRRVPPYPLPSPEQAVTRIT